MTRLASISEKTDPDVDDLRDYCWKIIREMKGSRAEIWRAKAHLDEMILWLRLARERGE